MSSEDKNLTANHLKNLTNSYLLQHLYNAVDWYPWCDEVFKKAEDEKKMIFLSIGYSTCHWCHVMAHESFEDDEVAKILNDNYIAVKVDREERPDIDNVYMSVCQALTGSGGWPLTIIMTADKKPLFAGTYFPKNTTGGRIGLIELLKQISNLWRNDRQSQLNQSAQLVEHFKNTKTDTSAQKSYEEIISNTYQALKSAFESDYGGFNLQPKFPTPHNLFFLIRYYKYTKEKYARNMVEKTLNSMYDGGIFDHVGYGFSRYSTDKMWLVPHFEKMLYDNALLILAYCEAYAVTNNEIYRDIVIKIISYLTDEMMSPEGAFYSAQDADSEGVEGKYYVFSYKELDELLDRKELEFLIKHYNVSESGNFEGKNILNKINTSNDNTDLEKVVIKKLYDYREKRVHPFLDTKILSSWNCLMIAALSFAGRLFDSKFIDIAKQCEEFISQNMMDDTILYTSYKDLKHSDNSFMADYANMIWGLTELFSATRDIAYLSKAVKLQKYVIKLFWDEDEEKFYMTDKTSQELPIRPKDDYDGAMPSGNSVTIMNLVRLYNITHDAEFKEIADKAVKSFAYHAENSPSAYTHYNAALLIYTAPHRQVVITGKNDVISLYDKINSSFLPFTTIIVHDGSKSNIEVIPELDNYLVKDEMTAYICENFTCGSPISDEGELFDKLSSIND